MIVVIDNYDSFVHNLVQYLGQLGTELRVFRNDQLSVEQVRALRAAAIVLSPGPGRPSDAGICRDVARYMAAETPILGVCLGHQAIGEAFGAAVIRARRVVHGKTSLIYHDGRTIYRGLDNPFIATRYHSLIVSRSDLPDCLEVSAWTDDGLIMGVRHKSFRLEGVQFHPESILTLAGARLIANFVHDYTRDTPQVPTLDSQAPLYRGRI